MSIPAPTEGQPDEPDWKSVEKVVALLEKILTPEATVRHNVFLPIIGHPNRSRRQCDVVITFGRPPRESIAIVEVQKRQSKPEINDFNGWVEKMREVGAQRLFCVSAQGYPDSIIDKAANDIGPTVVLLHLEDLQQNRIPGLVLSPVLLHRHPQFTLKSVGRITLRAEESKENVPGDMTANSGDKLFRTAERGELSSLDETIARILERDYPRILVEHGFSGSGCLALDVDIGAKEPDLWLDVGGTFHKVRRLPVTLEVEILTTRVPLTVQGYRQEHLADTLAWVATATGDVGGKAVQARIVFKPGPDGILGIASVEATGVANIGLLLSPDRGLIESITGPVFDATTP